MLLTSSIILGKLAFEQRLRQYKHQNPELVSCANKMEKTKLFQILIFICFAMSVTNTHAIGKYAVVIGNSDYQHVPALRNPVNDARDMAASLDNLGFDVILVKNASKLDLEQAIDGLIERLEKKPGLALFYYAGHGIQLEGNNYLIPVESDIQNEQQIKQQGYNVAVFLDKLDDVKNETNIVLLDACRDNPFTEQVLFNSRSLGTDDRVKKSKMPAVSTGLSELDAPTNTIIGFATAPGDVAYDGGGNNSPYTLALLESMNIEGLTIEQVFKRVREKLVKKTNGKQVPWESSSLVKELHFKPRKTLPSGW